MAKNLILFLDDYRDPMKFSLEYDTGALITYAYLNDLEIIWVKSHKEFVEFLEITPMSKIARISLDHDLSAEHYGGGDNDDRTKHLLPTGLESMKYLVEMLKKSFETTYPIVEVHSLNPIGKADMLEVWEEFTGNIKET